MSRRKQSAASCSSALDLANDFPPSQKRTINTMKIVDCRQWWVLHGNGIQPSIYHWLHKPLHVCCLGTRSLRMRISGLCFASALSSSGSSEVAYFLCKQYLCTCWLVLQAILLPQKKRRLLFFVGGVWLARLLAGGIVWLCIGMAKLVYVDYKDQTKLLSSKLAKA